MKVRILFDKDAVNKNFYSGWGVSYLINNAILFDAGEKSNSLFSNMEIMGVRISDIKAVVISHDHWDHRGGLWDILKKRPNLKVYACPHFSKRFMNRVRSYGGQLIEADKFMPISKNVYTTGEIEGRYAGNYMPEQALVLKTPKGLTIVTGCAHPGIIKVIENVRRDISGNIYLALGGFHLMGKHKKTVSFVLGKLKQSGVKNVAPAHCSGKNATGEFKEAYGDNFIEVKVGQVIEV